MSNKCGEQVANSGDMVTKVVTPPKIKKANLLQNLDLLVPILC